MSQNSHTGPIALALAALAALILGVMPAPAGAEEPAPGAAPAGQAAPVMPLPVEPVIAVHPEDEGGTGVEPHGWTGDEAVDQAPDQVAGQTFDESHGEAPDATVLTDADPWIRWLVALEHAVTAREAARHPEANLLFPLDTSAGVEPHAQPYRHLAIAKAVGELENGGNRRKSGHGGESEGHGGEGSPLLALANARNYLNLSEYDQALEWYRQAAARDGDGHFRRETGRETLMAAICARDTAAAGLAVAATLAAPDYAGRESEVVLAFRWLLNRQDAATLNWLLERTAAPQTTQDARVAFWRAYALSWLDRRSESLAELRALLALGGSGRNLNERERSWVLTATADLLLLAGSRDEAMALYARLAESPVASLRLWGRLQSASLAFLAHRYGEAGAGFRDICRSDSQGTWGAHACAMADIAGQLDKLLSEGERYGADAHYRQ